MLLVSSSFILEHLNQIYRAIRPNIAQDMQLEEELGNSRLGSACLLLCFSPFPVPHPVWWPCSEGHILQLPFLPAAPPMVSGEREREREGEGSRFTARIPLPPPSLSRLLLPPLTDFARHKIKSRAAAAALLLTPSKITVAELSGYDLRGLIPRMGRALYWKMEMCNLKKLRAYFE